LTLRFDCRQLVKTFLHSQSSPSHHVRVPLRAGAASPSLLETTHCSLLPLHDARAGPAGTLSEALQRCFHGSSCTSKTSQTADGSFYIIIVVVMATSLMAIGHASGDDNREQVPRSSCQSTPSSESRSTAWEVPLEWPGVCSVWSGCHERRKRRPTRTRFTHTISRRSHLELFRGVDGINAYVLRQVGCGRQGDHEQLVLEALPVYL
jgi:hypothetical protein